MVTQTGSGFCHSVMELLEVLRGAYALFHASVMLGVAIRSSDGQISSICAASTALHVASYVTSITQTNSLKTPPQPLGHLSRHLSRLAARHRPHARDPRRCPRKSKTPAPLCHKEPANTSMSPRARLHKHSLG